ncbi:MAG: thiosulfate oxidation carrier complex protein SoxZ [Porticoccaceae bacterium]|nr:thiosulfate oxidation carrier complex protein SoxZ [Porticoccaceae bacterium]
MAAKVKIRGKLSGTIAKVKLLIPHPMETGTRRDADGTVIPAKYIETVTLYKNGQLVMTANWGQSVSKDPYLSFQVNNSAPGDVIKVDWVDNMKETGSGEITLK